MVSRIFSEPMGCEITITPNRQFLHFPRKLKKAAKNLYSRISIGKEHFYGWELAPDCKCDTKWKRRAFNKLKDAISQPILKIPHFTPEEIDKGIQEWMGHAVPVLVQHDKIFNLKTQDNDKR